MFIVTIDNIVTIEKTQACQGSFLDTLVIFFGVLIIAL